MYLFGASGHAKVILDILKSNRINALGLFDDNKSGGGINGLPIVGVTEDHTSECNPCIVAIGDNGIRKNVVERLRSAIYASALHAGATVAEPNDIAEGTVVMAGAVINPSTKVGRHCIVNTSASVDHDCTIGDFVHIAPNATLCGGVSVGEGTLVGSGATIIPNISIGKWVVVGAGTVVIADVPDYAVVVGNPGRLVKIQQHE
ncbi:4-amino-6-deoxy-N-Acetyl-D-hexosaminyl-(Lipid carrier) acetyltrasferase [Fulvivirga imtechensis AK7]|uniref:4-amino-6-deoxy-N-Acetyl-D-hexosaminyl-(Lipid carrier) acetyltrasferase n=1 Tax=Fulvivirga imtechensis AK7 TaxID=1237149 RepID=L8JNS5_9BACT|nr:acetyltransferase [Fulvivirga imtechensis]ELR70616.1 4-amino-6-deoxy-N-Acetyl-D-hexosaminyl-(Lipid carrier) acetyltrasferase [Fulvivirga imtechensis AK7]